MFIDTHFHMERDDRQIFSLARLEGVGAFIVSCCDKKSISSSLDLVEMDSDLYFSLGYHPSEACLVQEEDLSFLESVISRHPRVVAIGEIGLDYHYGKEYRDQQIDLFRKQLSLAVKLSLPVVIHSRDATFDTIQLLKEYPVKGVIHCFNGSLETAKEYIKMGFLLGIGGVITFSNSKLYQVVAQLPLSSLVLETDSPYLAPVPFRGSVNSPRNIPIIAKRVSEVKGVSLEDLELVTTQNARLLFDLDKHL